MSHYRADFRNTVGLLFQVIGYPWTCNTGVDIHGRCFKQARGKSMISQCCNHDGIIRAINEGGG